MWLFGYMLQDTVLQRNLGLEYKVHHLACMVGLGQHLDECSPSLSNPLSSIRITMLAIS